MRELTDGGVPFSFEHVSCNLTKSSSTGLKAVNKALLRTGYNKEHSAKHSSLIGYIDLDTNKFGWFYIPLLMKFNNINIK